MKQLFSKHLPKIPVHLAGKPTVTALPLFALAFFLLPASAQAQSLGDIMCSISFNIAPFEELMAGLAYIAGAIFIGSGLLQMVKHHDMLGRSEHQLYKPIAHMIAGACLLALPSFVGLAVFSIFGITPNAALGDGLTGCQHVIVGYDGVDHNIGDDGFFGGNLGLDGLMLNLVMNIKDPMVMMLTVMCVIIGVFLIFRGLVKGAKFGSDPRANSVPHILASIIIGSILFTIGTSLNSVLTTVFGSDQIGGSHTVLSAIAADFTNTGPFQQGVYAALTFAQLIGMIAFIRGWLILKDAAEGQGQKTVAQGLTHILGGVLAVNIYTFLQVLDTTFGTGFL